MENIKKISEEATQEYLNNVAKRYLSKEQRDALKVFRLVYSYRRGDTIEEIFNIRYFADHKQEVLESLKYLKSMSGYEIAELNLKMLKILN